MRGFERGRAFIFVAVQVGPEGHLLGVTNPLRALAPRCDLPLCTPESALFFGQLFVELFERAADSQRKLCEPV